MQIRKTKKSNWKTQKTHAIKTLLPIMTLIFIIWSVDIIGTVNAAPASIFEDGFESNNFNSWDYTRINPDGSLRTSSGNKYSGNYGAEFTTNNYDGYVAVSVGKKINAKSELYARAYFKIDVNGIYNNGNKFYLIRFSAGRDNVLFAGFRKSGSITRWELLIRDGSGYRQAYSSSIANTKQWFDMEVYWQKDTNNGKATLWINGNQEINIDGQNTNNYGDITQVHFGVAEAYKINYSKVYGDDFAISDQHIGQLEKTDEPQQRTNPPNSNEKDASEIRSSKLWGINLGQPKPYYKYPFFSQPETRQTLKDAGMGVVRIFDKWETWQNIETVVNIAVSSGYTPIYVVSGKKVGRLPDLIKRVGDKVIFQIGNEPNFEDITPTQYAQNYKRIVDETQSINPNAKFMVAAIGVWSDLGNLKAYPNKGLDYITETIKTGAKIDYVSFHYYAAEPGESLTKEKVLNKANNYAEIVDIISGVTGKPVACTEWNFAQWDATRYDLDETFIKEWTRRAMNGLKECAINTMWFAQHWYNVEHPLTILHPDGSPKPSYYALIENQK